MYISNKTLRECIIAWEGHVLNETDCGSCARPEKRCPINKFFKNIERQLNKK